MPPNISGDDNYFVDLFGDKNASENDTIGDNEARNGTDQSSSGKVIESTQEGEGTPVSNAK